MPILNGTVVVLQNWLRTASRIYISLYHDMNSSNQCILNAPIYRMASGTLERELEWKTAPHMQGKISNMSILDRHTMPYMGIELISLGNGVKQNIAILVISLGNGVGCFLSYAYRHNSCSNGVVGDLGIFANLPLN